MSCTPVLSAYKRGCKTIAGITDLWLIAKDTREAVTDLVLTVTDGALSITPGVTQPNAYHIQPRQNSFNFTQPRTDDNNAGTTFVTQTLTGMLHGYSASLVHLANELAKGRVEALIKLKNGTYIYAGLEASGLESGGGDAASGQATGDAAGITITLTSDSEKLAPVLTTFSEFTTAFTVVEPS